MKETLMLSGLAAAALAVMVPLLGLRIAGWNPDSRCTMRSAQAVWRPQ